MAAKKKKPEETEAGSSGSTRSLRDEAEARLARSRKISPTLKGQTPEELIHELQVHQIELEMQAEELRGAQLALGESRDKYLDLYEFAPLGYLTLSDKALITDVNLTGATLLGVERDEIINHGLGRFITPGDLEEWNRYFAKVRQYVEKQICTLTLKRGGGSVFPARLEGIRIPGSGGAITVRIAFSDITDIWQIEALRESEERYRRLFESAQDGILILNRETGEITDSNPFIETLTGYSKEELIGKPLWNIGFFKDQAESKVAFKELQAKEFIRYEDLPLETKNKKRIEVECVSNVYPINSKISVIQCNIRDITERKKAEDALRQANKQLNLLSSITRHDILNQLLALRGYLELSRDYLGDNKTLSDFVEKEDKIAKIIDDQISFTRDYQSLGVAAPEWQNVNESIRYAMVALPMRGIHVEVDPADPEVYSDPLFEKVFYNLIDNALRYGGADLKTIRVSSAESDRGLTIICEDDGVGISAEDKKRLFTRGFGKNTGLGLFLSREILAITGITITENGEPGTGARFEIIVPKGGYRFTGTGRK